MLAHLDPPLAVAAPFARPRQRLVHVSAFQYPETADVFLGLEVRPVGDEDPSIGLPRSVFACRRGIPQANFLTPAAIISLLSAWISRPIASVHRGRVEVVGKVTSNQILRHCRLLHSPSDGALCPVFKITTNGQTGFLQAFEKNECGMRALHWS